VIVDRRLMILCVGGDIEIRSETCRPHRTAVPLRRHNPLKAQVTLGNYLLPVGPQMAEARQRAAGVREVPSDAAPGAVDARGGCHDRYRMNSNNETPSNAGVPRSDDWSQYASKGLHSRLLHVSRLATMGELAGGVSHELNQPLTAIANYAHACDRLLARPGADLGEVREALHQITLQTTRAADIIRRLRKLADRQSSEHLPASVNLLVQELQDLLETDAGLHRVELSLQLAAQLPEVLVDGGQIQQVVLNFFRNSLDALAARAPSDSPRVIIRTSATADNEVELAVSDNGPGLAPGLKRRLFDPFFSTNGQGSGLGLAISNTVARAHGGSVGYRSSESGGACFYIRLPVRLPNPAAEPAVPV
jgi:signal transduction histidine kinase